MEYLRRLIDFLKSIDKGILKNIFFTGFVQFINVMTPLIITPYLTYTVGIEKFGVINFVWATVAFMNVFTDFGFDLTATRKGSLLRSSTRALSVLFSRVVVLKFILAFVCCLVLMCGILFIPRITEEKEIFFMGLIMIFGYSLNSFWFFQAIEKMMYISIFTALSRLTFIGMLFFLVTQETQYIYVPLFFGIGNFLAGIISIFLIMYKYKIKFNMPSVGSLKNEFKEGWLIAISNFSISVYMNSATILIGLFLNETILGYYSIVEKIIYGIRRLISTFQQAIYPRICFLTKEQNYSHNNVYLNFYFPFLLLLLTGILFIYCFDAEILSFLSSSNNNVLAIEMLHILLFIPLIVALNGPSYLNLLSHKKMKEVSVTSMSSSIFNLLLSLILIYNFGIWGVVAAVIITESAVTLVLLYLTELKYPKASIRKILKR